jgi:Arm DNA-binding domain
VLRCHHGGWRRELTIGRYPDIGLAQAPGIATLKSAEVQQGRNPAAEKQKAKATTARDWTVRDLAKDYRAKKLMRLAQSTQVSYGRHLKRAEKKLGTLNVREIAGSDVVALIEGAGFTWGESNMLLITTKRLFTHAIGKRLTNVSVRRTRLDDGCGAQAKVMGCHRCGGHSAMRLACCVGSRPRTSRMYPYGS